jgi:hypothetical protein
MKNKNEMAANLIFAIVVNPAEIITPGSIVQITGKTPFNLFERDSYQYVIDVNCNGTVVMATENGNKTIVDMGACKLMQPSGKSTLKNHIKYLILYWIQSNLKKGNVEFNGITLACFVKNKVNRPNMYNPTVFAYMNQMTRQGVLNVRAVVRSKSLYRCDYISLSALENYYN